MLRFCLMNAQLVSNYGENTWKQDQMRASIFNSAGFLLVQSNIPLAHTLPTACSSFIFSQRIYKQTVAHCEAKILLMKKGN